MGRKSRKKWLNRQEKELQEQNKNKGLKNWLKIGFIAILALVVLAEVGYIGWKKFFKEGAMTIKDNEVATLSTNLGDIQIQLYRSVAPKTVDNFVSLSKEGFYDGVRFHRVIKEFMIQAGDPLSKDVSQKSKWGTGGPDYKFEDEINPWYLGLDSETIKSYQDQGYIYDHDLLSMKNDVGVIAMANSGPNTNGSQFFIITEAPQSHLDGKHTVFGEVIVGMDVVKKIAAVETDASDRPLEDVIINSITIDTIEPKEEKEVETPEIEVKTEDGTPIEIELVE